MAVRIRLMRMGKIRSPQYRIVVADARKRRDGRAIENLGIYHPKEEPSRIEVKSDRVQYWLSVGAQPSDPVRAILRKTGDWQKFRGLTPPSTPLKTASPRIDQHAVYEAEAKAAAGLADAPGKGEAADPSRRGAGQPAKKAAKKGAKKAAPRAEKADTAKADAETADTDKADKADAEPKAEAGNGADAAAGQPGEASAEPGADGTGGES